MAQHISTYMSSFLRSVPEVREAVRAHNAQKFEDNLEDWEIKTMWAIWLGLEIPWLKSYEGQKIGEKTTLYTHFPLFTLFVHHHQYFV